MKLNELPGLMKQTFKEWSDDKAPRLGAALAYYTVFSIPPLLAIIIGVAGLVFGREAVEGQVMRVVDDFVGQRGAEAIQTVLQSASQKRDGIIATVVGTLLLLLGASGVFGELQESLNTIWEVKPKEGRGIWQKVRERFLSMTMVVGSGFLLMVSLVVTTALSAFGDYIAGSLPGGGALWQAVNQIVSLAVITGLFALIFKFVPDAKVTWHDVGFGAFFTAVLFTLGKILIGLYLGRNTTVSAYGAAGSIIVLLVWVYYSAQILFLGAEFTQVYANRFGSRVVPAENAERVTEAERANEGIPHTGGLKPVTS